MGRAGLQGDWEPLLPHLPGPRRVFLVAAAEAHLDREEPEQKLCCPGGRGAWGGVGATSSQPGAGRQSTAGQGRAALFSTEEDKQGLPTCAASPADPLTRGSRGLWRGPWGTLPGTGSLCTCLESPPKSCPEVTLPAPGSAILRVGTRLPLEALCAGGALRGVSSWGRASCP